MNELVASEKQLPGTLPELSKFVLVGREKLTAVRAEIRAIKKVGLAKEVHEQKLREAQAIAEAVLDAEVRIGELTAAMPKASGGQPFHQDSTMDTAVQSTKKQALEEIGLTEKQANRFETLAKHPEVVEQAKADARSRNDIVNRSNVLKAIAETREPKRDIVKEAKEKHEAFKQSGVDDVVSIQEVQADKQNKKIIYADKAKEIIKLLNSILNYGTGTEPEEAYEMVSQCFTSRESAVFAQECRMAIEIIKILEGAFNGKTQRD